MTHLLARKRSVRSKNSESISTTASDQKSREDKSAPYKHPNYAIVVGLNTIALLLALPSGLISPSTTAVLSNGSAILASLNGMRPALRER